MVYIYLLVPYFIFKLLYSGNMSFLKYLLRTFPFLYFILLLYYFFIKQ